MYVLIEFKQAGKRAPLIRKKWLEYGFEVGSSCRHAGMGV